MRRPNFKHLFDRQKGERLVHNPTGDPAMLAAGGFHVPAWERTLPPDLGGAGLYAYEGLTLPPTPMLGAGTPYRPQRWLTRPMVAAKTTLPTSYGTPLGAVYTQPLYDPLPQG